MGDLPKIGVGCAALSISSEETSDEAAIATLIRAYEAGIRYFDVAPLYGGRRGEVLLGTALRHMKVSPIISTKVGYAGEIPFGGRQAPEERRKDFSVNAITGSITDSLRHLNREKIDIVYLHDPSGDLELIFRESIPALERLRSQGTIGAIGVGTTNIEHAAAILDRFSINFMLLAGRWTLIDRTGESIIERCQSLGVGLVAGGVFNSGILAADQPENGSKFDYGPAPAAMVARALMIHRLCAAAGVSLKAAAVQFAGRHPGVSTTLLGPRTRDELDELLTLLAVPVPQSLWVEIDTVRFAEAPQ
jgi:D-threo-aldose 1-dehydrogenase